jgi:hypothetical protein
MIMFRGSSPRTVVTGASAFLIVCAAPVGVAQAATSTAAAPAATSAAAGGSTTCPLPVPFRVRNFSNSLSITNPYLPLRPGTRLTYRGQVQGVSNDHEVQFTVTDLFKVVDGVRVRVVRDVDSDAGVVSEAELSFWAQDDGGNVWNLGEYPEEYDNGQFTGAPSTWITGEAGAQGGIHMFADPTRFIGQQYLQGRAPRIDFLDCATVEGIEKGTVTVPAGTFRKVLLTDEVSPLAEPNAIQTKEYAPNVGIVRIGAQNDPAAETLQLVSVESLNRAQLARVDQQALALDRHAYQVAPRVYGDTTPARVG